MSNTWFTADTHFGHKNIMRLSNRPFGSIEEHDQTLIDNWNRVVGVHDTVYHLGDFHFGGVQEGEQLLRQLNGKKILIKGNHDRNAKRCRGWEFVCDVNQAQIDNTNVVMFHYPMMEWAGAFRGAYHFFGHVHGKIAHTSRRCDVGVDMWDYTPINMEQIKGVLKNAPKYDPLDNYGGES